MGRIGPCDCRRLDPTVIVDLGVATVPRCRRTHAHPSRRCPVVVLHRRSMYELLVCRRTSCLHEPATTSSDSTSTWPSWASTCGYKGCRPGRPGKPQEPPEPHEHGRPSLEVAVELLGRQIVVEQLDDRVGPVRGQHDLHGGRAGRKRVLARHAPGEDHPPRRLDLDVWQSIERGRVPAVRYPSRAARSALGAGLGTFGGGGVLGDDGAVAAGGFRAVLGPVGCP